MEKKYIRYGNHKMNNKTDGYVYSFNTSKSYDFNSHMHDCFEFIHVIHGKLLYTVEGSEYMLSDGDFIMTKPEELHSFSFPEQGGYQREFLHIYPGFLKSFPELVTALNSRKAGYMNRFSAKIVRKYGIDDIFRELRYCCSNPDRETELLVLANTLRLIAKVEQIIKYEAHEKQKIVLEKKSNSVIDYIGMHFQENITLDDIAGSMYISPSYLSRLFKKETGMTVKTYVNMCRVTRAKNLIAEGRQITNLFMECGFSDYSTFYRAFVKYTGMSPDEFRNSHMSI